jgi:small subunit ribosomal protein S17
MKLNPAQSEPKAKSSRDVVGDGIKKRNLMERNKRKAKTGVVVGDKMDKTRVIEVVRVFKHPKYSKVLRRRSKFYAHDEKNETHIGDKVKITETRPLSKLKRWIVAEVVEKAQ